VLLGKPIGMLVDRVDSRVLLVVTGLAQTVACLGLAYATTLPAVLVGVVCLSAMTAISSPTRAALLVAMVLRDDLPRATAIGQTAGSIGMMGGPALAGFLIGDLGPQSTVRFGAIGGLATVIAAFVIRTRRGGAVRTTAQSGQAPTTTVDEAGRWRLGFDRLLRAAVWGLTAVTGIIAAVNVVIVFFVLDTLGSTPKAYGVIDASWMVGMLVGAWVAGLAVRPTTTDAAMARNLMVATGLLCVVIIAAGSMVGPWWLVPCYLAGGTANAVANVLGSTLLGRRVPAVARGRAGAAATMRLQGGSLIGFVLGGALLSVGEPRWIIIGSGVAGLITAVIVSSVVNRVAGRTGGGAVAPAPVDAPAVSAAPAA